MNLGPGWTAVAETCGDHALPQFLHQDSGLLFAAVPGGELAIGGSADERAAAEALACDEGYRGLDLDEYFNASAIVAIEPFLCARAPISAALCRDRLGVNVHQAIRGAEGPAQLLPRSARAAAREASQIWGFDTLTDAQWEWVAREGGRTSWIGGTDSGGAESACAAMFRAPVFDARVGRPAANGFGVWGLSWGEFVDDAERIRGGAASANPWQLDEVIACLAAYGYAAADQAACLRFAVTRY